MSFYKGQRVYETRAGVATLTTVAQLAGLDTEEWQKALVDDETIAQGGLWRWSPDDHTVDVAGDPGQLDFVAAAFDVTGAVGAWLRVRDFEAVKNANDIATETAARTSANAAQDTAIASNAAAISANATAIGLSQLDHSNQGVLISQNASGVADNAAAIAVLQSVFGQYLGAVDTEAELLALADVDGTAALEVLDFAILRSDDGTREAGVYAWNGTAWPTVPDWQFPDMLAPLDDGTLAAESATLPATQRATKQYVDDAQTVYPYLKETNGDLLADITDHAKIGDVVLTGSYWADLDLGSTVYRVVLAGSGTDDGGAYIDIPGGLLQLKALLGSTIDPTQFGARFDAIYTAATKLWSGTDDTTAWNSLATYLGAISNTTLAGGWLIDCPAGATLNSGAQTLPHRVAVEGDGHGTQLVSTGDQTGFFTLTGRYQHMRDVHFIAGGKGHTERPRCLVYERYARGSFRDVTFTQPHHDQNAVWWDESGVGNGAFSCWFSGILFHHDDPNAYPAAGDGVGITKPTWEHFGDGANFNANTMRDFHLFTGGGPDAKPCIQIGSDTTRVHNNVFDQITGELCLGGVLHVEGSGENTFNKVALHDTGGQTILGHTLKLGESTDGQHGSRMNTVIGLDRRDGTLATGIHDLWIDGKSIETTVIGFGERANQLISANVNGSTGTMIGRMTDFTAPGFGAEVLNADAFLFIEDGTLKRGIDTDNLTDVLALQQPTRTIVAVDMTKTADVDNNTAASTDPILLSGAGVGTWKVDGDVFYNSGTVADFATRLYSVGGGATLGAVNIIAEGVVNNDADGVTGQLTRISGLSNELGASGTSGGQDAHIRYTGTIEVTAGTLDLALRWAQRVSDASPTILRAGSHLTLTKMD